jgi:type IV pilus biogenesis protein CpaD/CtpE
LRLQLAAVAIVLGHVVGCAVVDQEETQATYKTLANWKTSAEIARKDKKLDEAQYKRVRVEVNRWIEGKKTELTIAGGELFSSVDTVVPEALAATVETALPEGIAVMSIPAWVVELVEWAVEQYKESRKTQASAAVGVFDGLKWAE